jgi:thiol-disulfide isomerase/thioredoxin
MKKLLPLIILITCVMSFAQSGRRVATPSSATPTAPIQPPVTPLIEAPEPTLSRAEFTFIPERIFGREIQAINGTNFRLNDFHGKVIVINIWASWCGPCRREIPEYEKVRKAYASREVEFVGLTTESTKMGNQVNRFVQEVGFGFRLGWADRDTAIVLMADKVAIPVTIVIDPAGRVVKHWSGYAPGHSGYRLKQTIEEALKTK